MNHARLAALRDDVQQIALEAKTCLAQLADEAFMRRQSEGLKGVHLARFECGWAKQGLADASRAAEWLAQRIQVLASEEAERSEE